MTKAPNDTTFHRCVVYRRLPYCSEKEKKHPNGVLSGASLHDAFDYYLAVDQENSTNFITQRFQNLTLECLRFEACILNQFYQQSSRNMLWPMFHGMMHHIRYNQKAWDAFVYVNHCVAKKLSQSLAQNASVLIHDYNFILVPGFLKNLRADISIAYFHHIPWNSYTLEQFYFKAEIINSLAQANVIAMHTRQYIDAYLLNCKNAPSNTQSKLLALPMPINLAPIQSHLKKLKLLNTKPNHQYRILTISRLDYTKGIKELLDGLIYTFIHKKYVPKTPLAFNFYFVETEYTALEPYRTYLKCIKQYLTNLIDALTPEQTNLITFNINYTAITDLALFKRYLCTDVLIAPSLVDGLNLIVKEYLAVRALMQINAFAIVSKFCGVCDELDALLQFDPYHPADFYRVFTDTIEQRNILAQNIIQQQNQYLLKQNPNIWIKEILSHLKTRF